MTLRDRFRAAFEAFTHPAALAAVSVKVDDSPGWQSLTAGPNDRDYAEMQELYQDALTAWRKNPMAKRIVDVTTDFCLGDGLKPEAAGTMGTFLNRWWDHPKNHMDLRLPELTDELTRAGDLFITLHRNPVDGVSYVRAIPKDRIVKIESLANDWETEIAFVQATDSGGTKTWIAHNAAGSDEAEAVMVHYKVNRVVGATLGESDLATLIPWLLRYSRMLEDRVRLNWAIRAFLWIVTVPAGKVRSKQEEYRTPPEGGSVIVKDDAETWEAVTPNLHAYDAQWDLTAVRRMIDSGSGMPPHWRGEPTDVNLATATAMERAASRHLRRRQLFLQHMTIDLAHVAYSRAYQIAKVRAKPDRAKIEIEAPDVSRQDNKDLATAAQTIADALVKLSDTLPRQRSATLRERILRMFMRFAGETLDEDEAQAILAELPTEGVEDGDEPTESDRKE
jgi:hypothetical protein